jgi:hypothetical protein
MISWFGPQDQLGYNLLVVPQNRWEDEDNIGYASRSSGLLGFPSLASRLVVARCGWCMWHHHGGHVEVKQETVGPMVLGAVQWKSDENTFH